MACGCGKGGSTEEKFEVRPQDGSAVKRFTTKADADVYAARTGGFVKDLVRSS